MHAAKQGLEPGRHEGRQRPPLRRARCLLRSSPRQGEGDRFPLPVTPAKHSSSKSLTLAACNSCPLCRRRGVKGFGKDGHRLFWSNGGSVRAGRCPQSGCLKCMKDSASEMGKHQENQSLRLNQQLDQPRNIFKSNQSVEAFQSRCTRAHASPSLPLHSPDPAALSASSEYARSVVTTRLLRRFITFAKSQFILLLWIYFHIDVFIRLSPPGMSREIRPFYLQRH